LKEILYVYNILRGLPDESIYNGNRLALPDEVWNFHRGDGVEKAFLLADFLILNDRNGSVAINIENEKVSLIYNGEEFLFASSKTLRKSILISGNSYTTD